MFVITGAVNVKKNVGITRMGERNYNRFGGIEIYDKKKRNVPFAEIIHFLYHADIINHERPRSESRSDTQRHRLPEISLTVYVLNFLIRQGQFEAYRRPAPPLLFE